MSLNFSETIIDKKSIRTIIYHGGGCPDGFCSAFIAWYYFKINGFNMADFEFLPAHYDSHDSESINKNIPNVKGKNVLICDYSYNFLTTTHFIKNANGVLILDHHLSNVKNLDKISSEYKVFTMDNSGAYITWKYFFGDSVPVPDLILYIQDNDLHIKKMENTNEIHTYMSTVPFEFEEWLPYLDNEKLKSVVPDGRAMLHINKKYITNAVRRGEERLIKIQGNNIVQRVVFCNSTELKSDIGHSLLERFAYSNFSAVYSMHNKSCSISLRSSDDRTDVEYISREFFSGGGHRNASACKNTTNNLPDTITLGRGDLCNAIDNAKLNILNLDNTIVQTIIINLTRVNFEKKIDMDDILKYLTQYREGSAIKEYQYLLKQKKKLESIDTVIVLRLFKKNVSTFIICFSDNSIKKFFDDYCSVHNNFEKFVLTPFSTMIEVNGDKHDLTFLKDL